MPFVSFCEIKASTPLAKDRELRYPRFGQQDVDCDLGCFIYATAASQ